jgi:hypothetical protein
MRGEKERNKIGGWVGPPGPVWTFWKREKPLAIAT